MARASRNLGILVTLSAFVAVAACGGGGDESPTIEGEVKIRFDPMYSAYDGVRDYTLPATIDQSQFDSDAIDPVLPETVKWQVDPAFASMSEYPALKGSVLLTTKKPGSTVVTVDARTKLGIKVHGSARLQITKADPAEWEMGEARYNNGQPLYIEPEPGLENQFLGVMQYDASCANCHAPSGGNLMNNQGLGVLPVSIEHTPQQTAGYSDEELIEIFTMARKPKGATFNSPAFEGVPEQYKQEYYAMLHTWVIAPEVERGIVYKLRSIPPKAQEAIDYERLNEDYERMMAEWEAMNPEEAAAFRQQEEEFERMYEEARARARAEAEARQAMGGAAGAGM